MEEMAATLPPADADHLRQAFRARLGDLEAANASMREFPHRVSAVLASPEFDENALRKAFEENRLARTRMDNAVETVLIDAVARMSPEGRKRLSEWQPPQRPHVTPR